MRALCLCLGLLLMAPLAKAQLIDCSEGCSETLYGLGNDDVPVGPGPFPNTHAQFRPGPQDGS